MVDKFYLHRSERFSGNCGLYAKHHGWLRLCCFSGSRAVHLFPQRASRRPGSVFEPRRVLSPPLATTIGQTDFTPLGGRAGQFHGPSFINLDFSVFKSFPVTERARFEFRGEGFNVLNHPNFGNSFQTLDFTNNNFGQINNTRGGARQVQLALKLYW